MAANKTFAFWSTTAAKRTFPADTSNAYITLYGTLTGDIWHVAAAQILNEYAHPTKEPHPFAHHAIHTCLTVMDYDKRAVQAAHRWAGFDETVHPTAPQPVGDRPKKKQPTSSDSDAVDTGPPAKKPRTLTEANCVVRGRKSWFYLKAIGCVPSLVIVPDARGSSVVTLANSLLSATTADNYLATQTNFINTHASTTGFDKTGFDRVMAEQIAQMWRDHPRGMPWPTGKGPTDDPRLIDLLCSTSVVMQMMDHLGVAEAQKILGYRLSGGQSLSQEARTTAEHKVVRLHRAIDDAVAEVKKHDSRAVVKGVVLFNFRIGDVNTQHDSNLSILGQVRKEAAAKGYVTIAIPQMDSVTYEKDFHKKLAVPIPATAPAASKPFMGDYTFDLLDVAPAQGAPAPYMDNTAKAYFWHLTASFLQGKLSPLGHPDTTKAPAGLAGILGGPERPPVVGLIGGRSGSTDLPAFVGVRVYSWEEPLLAALPPGQANPTISGAWNSSYYRVQGPQALRLFNQFPAVVTGSLDIKGFEIIKGNRTYQALDVSDGRLAAWLSGGPQDQEGPVPLPKTTHPYLSVSDTALLSWSSRAAQ